MKRFVLFLTLVLLLAALVSCDDLTGTLGSPDTTPPATEQDELCVTVVLPGETKTIYPNEAGEYTLEAPTRAGYEFVCWRDADGNELAETGTLTKSVTATAEWQLLETSTFEQLKTRIEAGADTILLTADITLTDSIYVVASTTLTAQTPVTLTRGADFLGDLFVLGETAQGENVILLTQKTASLALKPEGGSITVEGNGIAANGTVFLVLNSSTLGLYDGACIQNHTKLGNDHLTEARAYNVSYPTKVGGAAAILTSGAMYMYGGTIRNCSSNTTDSAASSCGGAVYNFATFYMYGGVIENCTSSRGGAVYNYRTVKWYGGTVQNNAATAYGGVMYMPSSQYACCMLGTEGKDGDSFALKLVGNHAEKSGGAIFGAHQSVIDILGSTLFDANTSNSNGGAINVAGTLTVNWAVFTANSCTGKGGAIYAYYGDRAFSTRIVSIQGGIFACNEAPRGGAIGFSGNDAEEGKYQTDPVEGAIGYIGNVMFLANTATKTSKGKYGNGGAIWATLESQVTVSEQAILRGNLAEDGTSHDVYVTGDAQVTIPSLQPAA